MIVPRGIPFASHCENQHGADPGKGVGGLQAEWPRERPNP